MSRKCCVCRNPSFDAEARAPLCEVCARLLAEHELSETEKAVTRMLSTFMQRMENAGLGERMNSLLQTLDYITEQELAAMTPEEMAACLPFTYRETVFAFGCLLDIMRVATTGESA